MGKPHNKETKAIALALLEANNGNATHTAREMDLPKRTVQHWALGDEGITQEVLDLVPEAKKAIRTELWQTAQKALKRLNETLQNCNDPSKLATTFAILVDKGQLLDGEPTARSENGTPLDYQARLDKQRQARYALRQQAKAGNGSN